MIRTIWQLEKTKKITLIQKNKILETIKDIKSYKKLTTKEGFLNFIMENIFSISVMFAYFGIEGIIGNIMDGVAITVPVIFVVLFLALLILESFLDDYIANNTKTKRKNSKFSKLYGGNKKLMMQLIEDVGGGSSSSEKIGQILLEEIIEDIAEIMSISNINNTQKVLIEKNENILKKNNHNIDKHEYKNVKMTAKKKN